MNKCPVCGGTPTICQSQSSLVAGTDSFTLCCGIGADIIEQWDVIEPLPQVYRDVAITQSRQARDEYNASLIQAIAAITESKPLPEELKRP